MIYNNPIKVVTLGGADGQSATLEALVRLKKGGNDIVITSTSPVSDSGGSAWFDLSGLNIPPSDLMRCAIALSDLSPESRYILNKRITLDMLSGKDEYTYHELLGLAISRYLHNEPSQVVIEDMAKWVIPGKFQRIVMKNYEESRTSRALSLFSKTEGIPLRNILFNLLSHYLPKERIEIDIMESAERHYRGIPSKNWINAFKWINSNIAIHGEVYPVSNGTMSIEALMSNGIVIQEESLIDTNNTKGRVEYLSLVGLSGATHHAVTISDGILMIHEYKPEGLTVVRKRQVDSDANNYVKFKVPLFNPTYYRVREEIENADYIIIGPGDLFTSIVPLSYTIEMRDLLKDKKIIFVCNTYTKEGETGGMTASDFVSEIELYFGKNPDYVILSDPAGLPERSNGWKGSPVNYDRERFAKIGYDLSKVYVANLAVPENPLRHDPSKLAKVLDEIIMKNN